VLGRTHHVRRTTDPERSSYGLVEPLKVLSVLLMVSVTVARRVVVEPLGPEAFLTGGIRWEQVFSCAESNSKNLCFHVEILHSLEELHRKADVVKLYWEANPSFSVSVLRRCLVE